MKFFGVLRILKTLILTLTLVFLFKLANAQFLGDHYTVISREFYFLKGIKINDTVQIYKDTISGWYYGFGFNSNHICVLVSYCIPDSQFREVFQRVDSIFHLRPHGVQGYFDTAYPCVVTLAKVEGGYTAITFIDYGVFMISLDQRKKRKT